MERGGRTERGITEKRRGAVTRGRRRGNNLSGLGPRKRKKRARPESPSASLLVPAPPTRATTNGDGKQSTGGGGTGVEAKGRGKERGRLGFIGRRCRFGNRPWAVKARASARRSRPKRRQRRMTPAGKRKGKRKGERGACPLPLWEKKEGERAMRRSPASFPWKHAWGEAGPSRGRRR